MKYKDRSAYSATEYLLMYLMNILILKLLMWKWFLNFSAHQN